MTELIVLTILLALTGHDILLTVLICGVLVEILLAALIKMARH